MTRFEQIQNVIEDELNATGYDLKGDNLAEAAAIAVLMYVDSGSIEKTGIIQEAENYRGYLATKYHRLGLKND